MGYQVGGLIFDSKDDYQLFKDIDENITHTVKSVENNSIELKEFFNRVKNINVNESYYNAREELDVLFENATRLLCYENTRFNIDYEVGCCFFTKINIIEYSDSDSDSDSVSDSNSGSDSDSDSDSVSDSDSDSVSDSDNVSVSD